MYRATSCNQIACEKSNPFHVRQIGCFFPLEFRLLSSGFADKKTQHYSSKNEMSSEFVFNFSAKQTDDSAMNTGFLIFLLCSFRKIYVIGFFFNFSEKKIRSSHSSRISNWSILGIHFITNKQLTSLNKDWCIKFVSNSSSHPLMLLLTNLMNQSFFEKFWRISTAM